MNLNYKIHDACDTINSKTLKYLYFTRKILFEKVLVEDADLPKVQIWHL